MGTKRYIDYPRLIIEGDMSSDITSPTTTIMGIDRVAFHLSWTGSPTGDFKVELSNDQINWVDRPLTPTVSAAGVDDTAIVEIETAAKYIRSKYIRTSGSGVLDIAITGKSISG